MDKYTRLRKCIKCGNGTRIIDLNTIDEFREFIHKSETRERIKRTCPNCNYHWYELPLDSDETEVKDG